MEVRYSKQALKFLQKQTTDTRKRVEYALAKLPAGDVKKMQNEPYYRLRVGNFRIIFDVNGQIVMVEKIGNRGEVYKK